MKKLFSLFAAVLFAGSMMAADYVLVPNNANAGTNSTSYITTLTEFTYQGVTWAMNQWNPSTLQVKTNQASAANEFRFYNKTAFSGKITKVVLKFSALTLTSTATTGFMFVGGSSAITATTGGTNGVWDATNKTITWTPASSDNFTYFAFFQNGKVATGTNKLAEAESIVITYDKDETAPELSASDVKLGNYMIEADEIFQTEVSVDVTAANLTSDIDITSNSSKLSFSVSSIDKAGGAFIITVTSGAAVLNEEVYLTSGTTIADTILVTGTICEKLHNPGAPITVAVDSNAWDNYFVNDIEAFKVGTSKKIGDLILSIPADAKKLYFMAAAWKAVPGKIQIVGQNVTLSSSAIVNDSINLVADDGVAGTDTAYLMQNGDWTQYQFVVDLSNVGSNAKVVLTSSLKTPRFVLWETKYTTDSATGLIETEENKKAVKRFENGQLIIEKNGIKYNALGEIIR